MKRPLRDAGERVRDVRRLLEAACTVYQQRAGLVPELVRTTGLSREGVELGFASLEQEATDEAIESLVQAAGDAEQVHVVLSANVFVAPLRAIALARAAAPRVTVRPSARDPVLARALVEAARDDGLTVAEERDVSQLCAGEIHVYGRDETIAAVRAAAPPGVVVRGHGAGMGVAIVTRSAAPRDAAEALARDVVAFDQRGCLSPRIAFVEGDGATAATFARAIHDALETWEARVPRGALTREEQSEMAAWRDAMTFAGPLHRGTAHLVALSSAPAPPLLGPPGRHLLVLPFATGDEISRALAPLARHVVAVGTDDPGRIRSVAPCEARLSMLGRMQLPPLDGPVDQRSRPATTS